MRQPLSILAVLASALAAPLSAQQPPPPDTTFHVLDLPDERPFLCRALEDAPPTMFPAATVMREFKFGQQAAPFPAWPREITVGFDSAGSPQFILDAVMLFPVRSTLVLVPFAAGDSVAGSHLHADFDSATVARIDAAVRRDGPSGLSTTMPAPERRPTTAEEVARARRLAAWLWERRCSS